MKTDAPRRDDRIRLLTTVFRLTDALQLKDALENARLPYLVRDKAPLQAYVQAPHFSQQDFFVPEACFDRALDVLHELFEVRPVEQLAHCPACGCEARRGATTCPECGLYLG